MGLKGKLVAAVEFKAGGAAAMCFTNCSSTARSISPPPAPSKCRAVICMKAILAVKEPSSAGEGREKTAKQVVQSIDEEKKRIEFKMLEGDLMEKYKDFLITTHVETKDGIDHVTWILDYQMLDHNHEHPFSLLSYFVDLTKDIEDHHL